MGILGLQGFTVVRFSNYNNEMKTIMQDPLVMMGSTGIYYNYVIAVLACLIAWGPLSSVALQVGGVSVQKVFLRRPNLSTALGDGPYCFVVSSAMDVTPGLSNANSNTVINNMTSTGTTATVAVSPTTTPINFLATQVWPAARMAACMIEQYANPEWSLCEFGCGPGLPSLTAAYTGLAPIFATDVDAFALRLVEKAAHAQGWDGIIQVQPYDLCGIPVVESPGQYRHAPQPGSTTSHRNILPQADLYILSDVFESSSVALGAASVTYRILQKQEARIWVFAQTDRVQREVYLEAMRKFTGDSSLTWRDPSKGPPSPSSNKLWLCDIDETMVNYG